MYKQLLIYYVLLILYGSLLPFDVDLAVLERFSNQLQLELLQSARMSQGGLDVREMLANYLLYIPLGVLFFLSVSYDCRFKFFGTFVVGLLISLAAELAQVCIPSRSASLIDLALNSFGALVGAGIGQSLRQVLRAPRLFALLNTPISRRLLTPSRIRNGDKVLWLLALCYGSVLVLRFDLLVLSVSFQREHLNYLFHVPFSDYQKVDYFRLVFNGSLKVLLFLPLGVFLAASIRSAAKTLTKRLVYWIPVTLVLLVFFVGIEVAQAAQSDRTSSVSDCCFYMLGVVAGVYFYALLRTELYANLQVRRQLVYH